MFAVYVFGKSNKCIYYIYIYINNQLGILNSNTSKTGNTGGEHCCRKYTVMITKQKAGTVPSIWQSTLQICQNTDTMHYSLKMKRKEFNKWSTDLSSHLRDHNSPPREIHVLHPLPHPKPFKSFFLFLNSSVFPL